MSKKYALISVSDKTGVEELAKSLIQADYTILSTGGTYKLLKENQIPVTKVSDFTGFPEILDGRVKTLHPKIHGGILAMDTDDHIAQMKEHDIDRIAYVIVNLYPFEATIKRDDVTYELAIENIDIGGPTMLRSAAKNHQVVTTVVDPKDYDTIIKRLSTDTHSDFEFRKRLALKVFQHTAAYDSMISGYLHEQLSSDMPDQINLSFSKHQDLRYGENPHQKAAFYSSSLETGMSLANIKQLHGKELSYNNYIDLDAAYTMAIDFIDQSRPFCCILKHTNPCGAALGESILEAYQKAVSCDPVSYFGGIVGSNVEIDEAAAIEMSKSFLECIIAPSFSDDAFKILSEKKNIRLVAFNKSAANKKDGYNIRRVSGGILVQEFDQIPFEYSADMCVAGEKVGDEEKKSLEFAWKLVKHVKSNAIVFVKDNQLIGVGAGQMSRIDSTEIAIQKAKRFGFDISGSILASDAFFPFRDNVDSAANEGVKTIIQPGGSIKDQEVIAAAKEHGITMIFTGKRHFNH